MEVDRRAFIAGLGGVAAVNAQATAIENRPPGASQVSAT